MFERRLAAVPAQVFIADGGVNGSVSIADTSLFKVRQNVIIAAVGQNNLELEVKKILSSTSMIVGPISGGINAIIDISAYTTTANAQIFANEQRRPSINSDEFERAVYEEAPTVAKRVILVDKFGNKYDQDNPLPTSSTFSGSISVGEVDQGSPNTVLNAWPVKITDGNNPLIVNSDGSVNVKVSSFSLPGLTINHNEISSVAAGVETTILTLAAPVGGLRVSKVKVSGDTIALFRVRLDGAILVNKRSWWTDFNPTFSFEDFANGLRLNSGQILTITVTHSRPFLGSFEATVMSV